jgi:hypothetical protein
MKEGMGNLKCVTPTKEFVSLLFNDTEQHDVSGIGT